MKSKLKKKIKTMEQESDAVIFIIIGALCTVTKRLIKGVEDLEIR